MSEPRGPEVHGAGRPNRTLLHTSDVHVTDAPGTHAVLSSVVDAALDAGVDLVVVAGDLFDHARVSEATVATVLGELARLDVPTVVIPGNHDLSGPGSLYDRVDLTDAGDHVTFLSAPEGRTVLLDGLGVSVWGRGFEEHSPLNVPLHGYVAASGPVWRIGAAHGHYFRAGQTVDRSSPIREEEIAALECDYLALGHWHRFYDVSAGSTAAFYCGSPSEGIERSVNVVELSEGVRPRIERYPIPVPAAV